MCKIIQNSFFSALGKAAIQLTGARLWTHRSCWVEIP